MELDKQLELVKTGLNEKIAEIDFLYRVLRETIHAMDNDVGEYKRLRDKYENVCIRREHKSD